MALLEYIILLMLWGSCSAEAECGPPDSIPIAELVGEWDKESYPHGTEATYLCRPGYIKVGRILWKCLNGEWKEVNPMVKCRNKPCGHPGDLLYGSFDLTRGTDFVFGSRVEYQCDDGYQMISRVNYRECTATGWNNYVPQCEVRKCLPVQPPQNGRIVMTSISDVDEEYPYGYILLFECDSPNYKLSGPNELYCMKSGEWSADVPACEVISCQEPSIPNGKMMSRLPRKMQYENKERIQYECDPGYKHESRGYSECIENGWNPAPSCIEIVCSFQNVVNGNLQPEKNVYHENERVELICNRGYQPENRDEFSKCTKTGWSSPLLCVHKDCSFPEIEDGRLLQTFYSIYKNYYFPMRKGKKIDYICTKGFFTEEGNSRGGIECTDEGWSPVPKCIKEALATCDKPPFISNGAIQGSELRKYKAGQSVTYRCINYYVMDGSPTVTCLQGRWSQPPTCFEPCTASDEEMKTNNIQLRWLDDEKLYVQHGHRVEFTCKYNYVVLPPSQEFRLTCIRGHLDYPKCIKHGSCMVSLVELVKNNLELGKEYTEVLHGSFITFKCKTGFSPVPRQNMKMKCHDTRLTYPKCTSSTPSKSCGPPLAIENGGISGTSISDYVHGSSVEYRCPRYYKLKDPKPVVCNDGEWSNPPECVEPCTLNEDQIFKNNIVLSRQHRNEMFYTHMGFVEFECKYGYRFQGTSPLRAQCVNQTLVYPKCS